MAAVKPQVIATRRRALANQFRASMGRIRSIAEVDLTWGINHDQQFMDEKEQRAVNSAVETLDKVEKHLGALARRLERDTHDQ